MTAAAQLRRPTPDELTKDVYIMFAVTVIVRGFVWLFSLFIIGPVGGAATFVVGAIAGSKVSPVLAEAVLTTVALAIVGVTAARVCRAVPGFRRSARRLSLALVAQTVFYLVATIFTVAVNGGFASLVDQLDWIAIVVAVNVPVLWLALRLRHRARALPG